ncbi:iron chelate uptake ABC transporter family permease subunit [Bacillus licheniformis]
MMNNTARKTKRRRRQSAVVLCALFACLFVLIVLNLAIGDENIGLWDVMKSLAGQGDAGVRFLVMEFRMPRILLAVLAGGALSVAGVVAQSLMKNPLAAPDTLGITGGAGLGAVIVTVLFSQQSPLLLTGAAYSGSVLAAILVYLLAYRNGISPVRLALVGIAVNAFCHSGIQLFISRGARMSTMH